MSLKAHIRKWLEVPEITKVGEDNVMLLDAIEKLEDRIARLVAVIADSVPADRRTYFIRNAGSWLEQLERTD